MNLQDIIRLSAYCVKIAKKTDVAKEFRQRARSLFETLVYQGLTYTLAYCGGKALENCIFSICKELREGFDKLSKASFTSDLEEQVTTEVASKIEHIKCDDRSYGLYGASLIFIITTILRNIKFEEKLDKWIYEYSIQNKIIQRIAYEAAKWLKFFAEAKIPT